MKDLDAVIKGESKCKSGQELCEYVIEHSAEYMLRGVYNSSFSRDFQVLQDAISRGCKIIWPKFTGMHFYRVHWDASTSNSHTAPRGKRTNWGGRDENEPRGYPGWTAQFRIWHDEDAKIIICDDKNTRIHEYKVPYWSNCVNGDSGIYTGSGGGLKDGYYCQTIFFAEDFPEMDKFTTFYLLNGSEPTNTWGPKHPPELSELGVGRTGYIVDGDPFD